MKMRISAAIAAACLTLLGITGCGDADGSGGDGYGAGTGSSSTAESTDDDASGTDDSEDASGEDDGEDADVVTTLSTADSDLGTIVVDGDGLTLYQFDNDTQGGDTSSCTGQCLTAWPPAHAGDSDPELDGVTGDVGTITGTDGLPQLTLNGWPLYYYAGDSAAGDTTGQGVNGVWWVLTPEGERITE